MAKLNKPRILMDTSKCPKCQGTHIVKYGKYKDVQNYKCTPCNINFLESYLDLEGSTICPNVVGDDRQEHRVHKNRIVNGKQQYKCIKCQITFFNNVEYEANNEETTNEMEDEANNNETKNTLLPEIKDLDNNNQPTGNTTNINDNNKDLWTNIFNTSNSSSTTTETTTDNINDNVIITRLIIMPNANNPIFLEIQEIANLNNFFTIRTTDLTQNNTYNFNSSYSFVNMPTGSLNNLTDHELLHLLGHYLDKNHPDCANHAH